MSLRAKKLVRARQHRSSARRFVLMVQRSHQHIDALLYSLDEKRVLGSVSTKSKALQKSLSYGGNCKAAYAVGQAFAELAKSKGIQSVAFDRNGFRFTGRVSQLAQGARDAGLEI